MRIPRLSQREKLLAIIVVGVVFVLLNLVLLNFLLRQHARLRTELAQKSSSWQATQTLFNEREIWERRDLWLQQNQPRLENEGTAGVQLLEGIKAAAQSSGVQLENPAIGSPERSDSYHSVPVSVESKSNWQSLLRFLHNIQAPQKFIVFEAANLQIDSSDPSQMRGRFRIAKWYAP
jgi:hypothetical protein